MTETTCDLLLHNATVATMDGPDYGLLQEGSVGITAGIITHLGARGDLSGIVERDLDARLLTPALVDCHTHLVYAGDRVTEFERRLGGASYEDLALSGGGIMSTVRTTRAAQDDDLFDLGMQRLSWLLQSGVGTVEIKSGYGLTVESELRMLRVARQLGEASSIRVTTSLLAAHAVPPGWDADTYVDDICQEVIRAAADEGLADSVDAFCETIAFSPAQVRRVFEAARAIGLPVRLHADQLSDNGGAALAAEFRALSADHLEHASVAGIEAMAQAGTVAVVIPGASAFLNEATSPPIQAMRDAGVAIAVSTDLNPGTSPLASLQAAMWLGAARFRMTPEETLAGTTRHAAAALGLADTGVIRVGMRADLAHWNVTHPAALSYWSGAPLCQSVWSAGEIAFDRDTT